MSNYNILDVTEILIEFVVSMKLATLIKMYLNKTHSKVRVRKHFSDNFPIQNSLKQGDVLKTLLFNVAIEHAIRRSRKTSWN
jgi:hypothetical protein